MIHFASICKRLLSVSVARPTNRTSVAQSLLRWVWAKDHIPDTPGVSKNAWGPVGIPWKKVPQVPGYKPSPSKEDYSLGGRPLEALGCWSDCQPRQNTPDQIHVPKNTANRSVKWLDPLACVSCLYLSYVPPTEQVWHKPF